MVAHRLVIYSLVGLVYASPIESPPREIDVSTARKLLVERYRRVFGDKYFRNPAGGGYYKLPDLEERALRLVSKSDGWWSLGADNPLGLKVDGRVDLAGRWVDIEFVGVASE